MQAATRKTLSGLLLLAIAVAGVGSVWTHISDLMPDVAAGAERLIPLSDAHHAEHDATLDPEAYARVQGLLSVWPTFGPPDGPNIKCVVLKFAGEVVRYVVWKQTGLSATLVARGDLFWYDATNQWHTYANKSLTTLKDVPTDLRNDTRFTVDDASCSDFHLPPLPPAPAG